MIDPAQYLQHPLHPKECGCQGCFARNPRGKTFAFHRHPHADNCDCSVCYVKRNWESLPTSSSSDTSRSTPCTECRPAQWSKVNGRNHVTPAYTCEKHTPPSRPEKYWSVVNDTGKPTLFVPLREPFELVG
ncbi:MAG TPA: DUF5447 family protein [Pseudomonas sp.]